MGGRWLTGHRPYLALALFCLVLYLPGLAAIPPLDRDEARFAQASAQMLESGDFIDIRFRDEPRHKKPAGIYWLQSASVALLSGPEAREIWAYRVPSVLGATLSVLLLFHLGIVMFDRRTAFLAAALLAGSVLLMLEAHQAKSDAALLATVLATQAALGRIYLGARGHNGLGRAGPRWAVLFWAGLGCGILIKGPIAPMVAGLTAIALVLADRDLRWLGGTRPFWGIPLMLAVAVPWFAAIGIASDGAFFREAVGHDMLGKIASAQESHGGPPGYHTLLVTALSWPGSLFLWPALAEAVRRRTSPPVRFCLAWLVPAWIVFEATATKLPHYTLPLFPALALLTAAAVLTAPERMGRLWAKLPAGLWAAVGVVLAAAAIAAPIQWGGDFSLASLVPAALALAAIGTGIRYLSTGRPATAATAGLVFGALALSGVFGLVLPQLDAFKLSQQTHDLIRSQTGTVASANIATAGYREPSLVFLLGTDLVFADGPGAAAFLDGEPGRIAIVDDRENPGFLAAANDSRMKFSRVGEIAGLNYSRGREAVLYVYRSLD